MILGNELDRCIYYAFVVALCLVPVGISSAGNYTQTVAHYKVSSKGFSIGDITTTQRRTDESGAATVHFETKTAVKASFLWMGYRLETVEKGILQKGELVSYARKGRENGENIDVEGHLENSFFRFDVREQSGVRLVVIQRNSYDYTTMECPEAHLVFSDKPYVTLNVLDVEKMAVVKREYRLVRNENYTVAGKEYPCRVVDYTDLNKKARRWISWDGSAIVMYRQDSRGGKNSYSVQATAVTKEL